MVFFFIFIGLDTQLFYMYIPALWSVLTISISSNKTALISAVWPCRFLIFRSQSEIKDTKLVLAHSYNILLMICIMNSAKHISMELVKFKCFE